MTASADQTGRPRLSVAMIVRNEEDVLAASIESVRTIADEIVVLDTGSTDQTAALARQLGAAVDSSSWRDDFSAARNRCLERVTGDWVLWLDAGEQLDAETAAELRRFIDQQADPQEAYMMLVAVPPAAEGVSPEQIARLRLMPNHATLRFAGRLRETLMPSINACGLQTGAAPGRIIRHVRQHDPQRRELVARRDLKLAAMEIAQQDPPPARLLLALGEARNNLGDIAEARTAYEQAIEVAEHGSTEMLEAYYGLLTSFEDKQSQDERLLRVCLEALEIFPLDAQLLMMMGNYLQSLNRLELAERSFDTAFKHGRVDLGVWHLGELAELTADCLALILQARNRDDKARSVLTEAIARTPDSTRLRRRMMELHIKHGRGEEAVALAEQLPVEDDQREPLLDTVRGACMAAQRHWTPALGYLQSAYISGCRDPLCLRWLSVTLLSNGKIDAAKPVLSEWRQLDPDNVEIQRYTEMIEQPSAEKAVEPQPPEPQPVETSMPSEVAGLQYRVDQGTSVVSAHAQLPVISQNTSADAAYSSHLAPRDDAS